MEPWYLGTLYHMYVFLVAAAVGASRAAYIQCVVCKPSLFFCFVLGLVYWYFGLWAGGFSLHDLIF